MADQDDADKALSYLSGDFSSLPSLESNIVRIFTSSTFTDMLVERNYLIQNVYPELRDYCQKLGMEFEVVDMRWGVNDDMSSDHMTTKLCLREIVNCQRLSQGPNFVALLGDKYGFRPFPSEIIKSEFELLLRLVEENTDNHLLQQWFWQDTNSKPAAYILQPITTHYPHYNNMKDPTAQEEDRKRWWADFSKLRRILRNAARAAVLSGVMNEEEEEKYNISVTESEVQNGVIRSTKREQQCLCFIRVFNGLDDAVSMDDVVPFVDTDESGNRDPEGKERSKILRFEKLSKVLRDINLNCFNVSWKNGGIDEEVDEHRTYLERLGFAYVERVKNMINQASINMCSKSEDDATISYQKEALSHAWFCVSKCKTFCGREEQLDSVRRAMTTSKETKIVVLHGKSGCGKTALMAKVTSSLQSWIDIDSTVIVRFLGTTPDSSNVHSLLKSVVCQIRHVFQMKPLPLSTLEDFNLLVQDFFLTLNEVGRVQEKFLVIVLDSLDQLSPSNSSFSLRWLPRNLPPNVFLILSTIAEYDNLLNTIQRRYDSLVHYVEVHPLELDTADAILSHYFDLVKRTVTDTQRNLLTSKFKKASEPLLLKLLFDEACNWKSYDKIPEDKLGDNILNAISLLFERLERSFGQVLISHAFGYIAASRSGLTEAEIEDILSLDNEVLNQVYAYWDPPLEGIIRLPPLLWKRVRYEVEEYLTERQADGVTVFNWYHRQFLQESEKRYLAESNDRQRRFQVIADYFLGTYANDAGKPILLTRRGEMLSMMCRQVASQPLRFSENRYNLRKLNELPIALVQAKNFVVLYEQVLFNFQWILVKLKATSVHETLLDYESTLEMREDDELRQLYDCLRLSSSNLQQNPESLASQLLGRLSYVLQYPSYHNTKRLLALARAWCTSQRRPVLMPLRTCMTTPGGFLMTTFKGHIGRVLFVAFLKGGQELLAVARNGKKVRVTLWIVDSMTQKGTFDLETDNDPLSVISKSELFAVVVCGGNIVKISLVKEDVEQKCPCLPNVDVLKLSSSDKLLCVGFNSGEVRIYQASDLSLFLDVEVHTSAFSAVLFDEDTVYAGFNDRSIRKIDIDGKILKSLELDISNPITGIQAISSMNGICVTSMGGHINLLSKETLTPIGNIQSNKCAIRCSVAVENSVIGGCDDGFLRMWDLNIDNSCKELKAHDKEIWCIATPENNPSIIVTGSKDDTLGVIGTENFEFLQRLVGHSSWISCVNVLAGGDMIISGSNDKNVKLWKWDKDAQEGAEVTQELFPHEKHPTAMILTRDCRFAISGSPDKCLVWDLQSCKILHSMEESVSCLDAGESDAFVIGSTDGTVTIYTLSSYTSTVSYQGNNSRVMGVKLFADDCFCVVAFDDGDVAILDAHSGRELARTKAHKKLTSAQVFFSDSSVLVATGSKEKLVKLWQVDTSNEEEVLKCRYSVEEDTSPILCMCFTHDGKYLMTGSRTGAFRCIDVETGEVIRSYRASTTQDSIVAILPYKETMLLAIHGPSDNLLAYDPWNEEVVKRFVGHTHAVMCLLVTEDEKYVISGSRDGTLKAWDAIDGTLLDSIDLQSQVKYAGITPFQKKSYRIAATAMSGSILLVDFFPNDQIYGISNTNEMVNEPPMKSTASKGTSVNTRSYKVHRLAAVNVDSVNASRCCALH